MEPLTQANGLMTSRKDSANRSGQMGLAIKGIMSKDSNRDMGLSFGLTEVAMMETSNRIISKDSATTNGQMGGSMKVNGGITR